MCLFLSYTLLMKLHLPQLNKSLEGSPSETVFQTLRKHDIPVASSCLGDGVCGKCRLTVAQGLENVSPIEPLEQKLIDKYSLSPQQRISCQCYPLGDLTITSTYW
jgi:2Fe-2S ferredoxin